MLNSSRLRSRLTSSLAMVAASLLGLALTSCTRVAAPVSTGVPVTGAAFSGEVHGGQQPVKSATIQLYAVSNKGDGAAATALLSPAATTNSSGGFNITGKYTCPSASALVYIVSMGGDPGTGTDNPNLAEMAALGPCGNLSASTYIVINEVTTVGSVYELAPYMTAYNAIGYGNDLTSITEAFAEVNEVVNIATGTAGGATLPTGTGVPTEQIYTLADILASCVNSTGSSAGDNTVCGRLLTYTGLSGTANTISAMLQIARNPGMNTSELYSLISPNSPFQPVLVSAPSTWNIAPAPYAATPYMSPVAGTYNLGQIVTIFDATPGATILYTTDGSTPNLGSSRYTGPFPLFANTTVKAIATAAGYVSSPLRTVAFNVTTTPAFFPVFSPAGGYYTGSVQVAITPSSGSPSIFYTLDGSRPTVASTPYTGPITISTTTRVSAIAVLDGFGTDYVYTQDYYIDAPPSPGLITSVAGGDQSEIGLPTNASQVLPAFVALDGSNNLYVIDQSNDGTGHWNTIRKIDAVTHAVSTVITSSSPLIGCGDKPVVINQLVATRNGDLYLTGDTGALYKVTAGSATLQVVASECGALVGTAGDGGPASSADVNASAIALDTAGNLYLATQNNQGQFQIRKISASTGNISTVAGIYSGSATAPDGGLATAGALSTIDSLAVDGSQNVYFTQVANSVVRRVDAITGILSTPIGNGAAGYLGDGGLASSASFEGPTSVALDSTGNIFVADKYAGVIRRIDHTTKVITTYAGNGTIGDAGDNGLAINAELNNTTSLTTDASGNLYMVDNYRVRKVVPGGAPSTIAGTPVIRMVETETDTDPNNAFISSTPLHFTITSSTAGASIYYTLDGSTPTTSSTLYTGPIALNSPSTTTINAIAAVANYTNSAVGTGTFTLVQSPGTVTFSPAPGTYTSIQNVTLSPSVAGAAIYYTTDGSYPTTGSALYNGAAIPVTSSETVSAIVAKTGYATSNAVNGVYTLNLPPAATPTFSLAPGTYTAVQTVSIADTTTGAVIHFTTDGTTPTASSPTYTGGNISIPATTTLQAVAIATGYSASTPASATYTINIPVAGAPVFSPTPGNYTSAQSVFITSSTSGAVIHYTTDGTTPTSSSPMFNGIPFTISTNTTYKALAIAPGDDPSPIVTAAYTINIPVTATPTFSPAAGTYTFAQTVAITSTTPNAVIYYTTDGSTPTGSSMVYSSPITVSYNQTVKAIAVGPGFLSSPVASAAYTITVPSGAGIITSVAGFLANSNSTSFIISGQSAISENIGSPRAVLPDNKGNFYFATGTYVTRVDASGILTIVAGSGSSGHAGDGGPATSATLTYPSALALDAAGNLYIADIGSSNVRKVTPSGTITTVVGNGTLGYTGDNGPATSAELYAPSSLAFDAAGNLYIADTSNKVIRKVVLGGNITTFAGNGTAGNTGDGGQATSAELSFPQSIVFDHSGNLIVASGNVLRSITPAGVISTIAGTGGQETQTAQGDGGPALSAAFAAINGVTIDAAGNLYVDDDEGLVRIITTAGTVYTYAGVPIIGSTADGVPALSAYLQATGISMDATGNLYIADNGGRVRVVTPGVAYSTALPPYLVNTSAAAPSNGPITVGLLSPTPNAAIYYTTDGSTPTTSSTLYTANTAPVLNAYTQFKAISAKPGFTNSAVAEFDFSFVAPNPEFYFPAGTYTSQQQVSIVETYGIATVYYTTDGSDPTCTSTPYNGPFWITNTTTVKAIACQTNYNNSAIVSATYTITNTTANTVINTVAGDGDASFSGDGGSALSASFNAPVQVAFDATGNMYVSDANNNRIRKVNTAGNISTYAGGGSGTTNNVSATSTSLSSPTGITFYNGSLYIADTVHQMVRKVSSSGTMSLVAGNGNIGYPNGINSTGTFSGDGGQATSAGLSQPTGLAFDSAGNLYIADSGNGRIRKVTPAGVISTFAGGGTKTLSTSDGLAATTASLGVGRVRVDHNDNVYIADGNARCIHMVTPAGIISTVAGKCGSSTTYYTGEGGAATSATLYSPTDMAFDSANNLYIADNFGYRIYEVSGGIISTVGGNGTPPAGGANVIDGVPATSSPMRPVGLLFDASGNLYVTDQTNERIRKVTFQ